MAKDVITRFKLETTAFDSAIKQASKELSDYSKTATKAKEGFNQFTKSNVDAARALGTMATSSTNAKQKTQELVGAFNEAAKAYNSLTKEQQQSDWAKALAGSLTQLQQRIKETKQEMQGLSGKEGGLFGDNGVSGMLQVFGGNLMTKAAGMVAGLGAEVVACMNESAELAKQAEGVQIAFARLGRGDILDGLREATHGTVSDLELMKAAVKFNDFRLPVEELGTMLAFAQQKAKDTGQSVDYMVDSIVTGLGRKSLMILDNLGLSAAEVKEKMKQTGDMTKAVGEIIREQMAKAGDYVETAADRAAQANVELQNAMLELGSTMREVFGYNGWDEMATGIKTELVGAITFTIETIGKAKEALKDFVDFWGNFFGRKSLKGDNQKPPKQTPKDGTYYEETDSDGNLLTTGYYMNGKKKINGYGFTVTGHQPTEEEKKKRKQIGGSGSKVITEDKDDFTEIIGLIGNAEESVRDLQKQIKEAPDETTISILRDQLKDAQQELDRLNGKTAKTVTWEQGLSGFNEQTISAWTSMIKSQLAKEDIGSALYSSLMDNMSDMSRLTNTVQDAIKLGLDIPQDSVQEMFEQVFDQNNLPADIYNDMIQKFIDDFKERTGQDLKVGENGSLSAGKEDKKREDGLREVSGVFSKLGGGLNQVSSGLQQLGVQMPKEVDELIGTINAVGSVISGIQTVISLFGNGAMAANTAAVMANTAAMLVNSGVSIIPYANGGVVHAAGGTVVGNTYSGDEIPAFLNAGEVVLNRAQVGNLAAQLDGGDFGNMQLEATIYGEDIKLALNNNGRRTQKGEFVQSRRRY